VSFSGENGHHWPDIYQHCTLQTLQDTSGDNPDASSEALEGSGVTAVLPNREAACSASEASFGEHAQWS
jgi:hypothetical protein